MVKAIDENARILIEWRTYDAKAKLIKTTKHKSN